MCVCVCVGEGALCEAAGSPALSEHYNSEHKARGRFVSSQCLCAPFHHTNVAHTAGLQVFLHKASTIVESPNQIQLL